MSEERAKRAADKIMPWIAVAGTVFGSAFGFGAASTAFKDKVTDNTKRICALEAGAEVSAKRMTTLEQEQVQYAGEYKAGLIRLTEQFSSINSRTERMENLLERILYTADRRSQKAH